MFTKTTSEERKAKRKAKERERRKRRQTNLQTVQHQRVDDEKTFCERCQNFFSCTNTENVVKNQNGKV
jgi:hypothetical protein